MPTSASKNPASFRPSRFVAASLFSYLALCLPCALAANPTTIYGIKRGMNSEGESVSLTDVLVTARGDEGCFVQVKQSDASYQGSDYSGIFVAGNFSVVAGQRINIPAATIVYAGNEVFLTDASPVITSPAMAIEAPPAPVVVTAAQIATGGSRSHTLEGVLVQVNQVTVASLISAGNEFQVDAGLRVDDLFYLADPFPWEGRIYANIIGPLAMRDGIAKVEPRGAADLANSSAPPANATLQSYQQWAADASLSGADALAWTVPHHDGVPNLLKYAFNLNGATPDVRLLTPGTGVLGQPAILRKGSGTGTTLTVEYLRRRNSGLVYTPQISSTLSSFTPFSAPESVTTIDGVWERVVVAQPLGSSPPDKLFATVKVELPTAPEAGGFALTPNVLTLSSSAGTMLTITLGSPAAVTTLFNLIVSNPALGTVPSSVTVSAGQSTAMFPFTGTGVAGEVTVTAVFGPYSHKTLVTLVAP